MTATVGLAAVLGAGLGLGVTLIVHGLTAPPAPRRRFRPRLDGRQFAASVAVAIAVAVTTRWPVAAVLAAIAVWGLPKMLGGDRRYRHAVARMESVATWAERLRDTLSAAAGLEQAIHATAAGAPPAIAPQVRRLAARLDAGERLCPALRRFADELADPTADLVVTALVLAVEHQARQHGELLGALATAARAQVQLRLRVAAGRARNRTSVRIIIATTLAMAAGLVVLNREYLAPYDMAVGQLVLLTIGVLFAGALAWISGIARFDEPVRLLTSGGPR
jgi:tight adherence protein B